MNISSLDKNFKLTDSIDESDIVWLKADEFPFKVYGACKTSPYLRLPSNVAETVSEGVAILSRHTAGIRVRFRTNSKKIAIFSKQPFSIMSHMPLTGICGYDLFSYKDGTQTYLKTFVPPSDYKDSFTSCYDTDGAMTDYIINFPLYCEVYELYIGLSPDAETEEPSKYKNEKPVIFYGSSITQGGCASRPGNCYQGFLSRRFDMDYVNLGFSGNCCGEKEIAEYMAGLSMSAFVCDYDHNAPSVAHLNETHFPLYETIRKAHPDIPYIMISKPDFFNANPDIQKENSIRREIVFESFKKAINLGDKNVYFINGDSIFGEDDHFACTVDGCHPNDLGFYRFYKTLEPFFKRFLND